MASPLLTITYGSTKKTFELAGTVLVYRKSQTGEVLRLTGRQDRSDALDAPWLLCHFHGIGIQRSHPQDRSEVDRHASGRMFDMPNMDSWQGMTCPGPQKQTPTGSTLLSAAAKSFAQAGGFVWVFQQATGAAVENLYYWVGSTTTWTNATATADWEAVAGAAAGFPVAAVVDGLDGRIYAIRTTVDTHGALEYLMGYATYAAPTVWTFPGIAVGASPLGTVYGAVVIDTEMFTVTWDGTSLVRLYKSTGTNFQTYSLLTTFNSPSAPTSVFVWVMPQSNGGFARRVHVATRQALWRFNLSTDTPASTMVQLIDFSQYADTNNAQSPVVWRIEGTPGGHLVLQQGRNIFLLSWEGQSGNLRSLNIAPTYKTQGIPLGRQGRVLGLAATGSFLYAAIGGEDATHYSGLFRFLPPDQSGYVACIGPIYTLGTANRQIKAMFFSTSDDNVETLHIAEEVSAGGATSLFYFRNTEQDPRTLSAPLHAATADLVFPIEDRDFPEVTGTWRKIVFTGSGFSANNKVSAVYASPDAAILDMTGSWGTSLGSVTASGDSVNFAATPTGTGQSAKAMQLRVTVTTTGQGPYITGISVYVRKNVAAKYIYRFPVRIRGLGTVRTPSAVIADLQTITSQGTDLSCEWNEYTGTNAKILEPYLDAPTALGVKMLEYSEPSDTGGTLPNAIVGPSAAVVTLVEV